MPRDALQASLDLPLPAVVAKGARSLQAPPHDPLTLSQFAVPHESSRGVVDVVADPLGMD